MSPLTVSSIPSANPAVHLPPESIKFPTSRQLPRSSLEANAISRRDAAVLLSSIVTPFLTSLVQPPLAAAFSLGIPGPKEWLKQQKRRSAKFLLAPVDASRNMLQSASLLLMKTESELGENDLDKVRELILSAARDCVPQDRNSFVVFQASTGVEVCTFQLILKNAASLLDDKDPVKLKAEVKLGDLIRSFTSLNALARGEGQLSSNRQRVVDALKDTISYLNNFDQGIKDCLEV